MTPHAVFEAESTLTERYQTTIPDAVRKVLGLGKHDKLIYRLTGAGEVRLVKAEPEASHDAALAPFLALLDKRLASHPKKIVPYSAADAKHDLALVKGVKIG